MMTKASVCNCGGMQSISFIESAYEIPAGANLAVSFYVEDESIDLIEETMSRPACPHSHIALNFVWGALANNYILVPLGEMHLIVQSINAIFYCENCSIMRVIIECNSANEVLQLFSGLKQESIRQHQDFLQRISGDVVLS